jgi:hypothetical protein
LCVGRSEAKYIEIRELDTLKGTRNPQVGTVLLSNLEGQQTNKQTSNQPTNQFVSGSGSHQFEI